MKKLMKRIAVCIILVLLICIPKANASEKGDLLLNESSSDRIYPESLTGSFLYLTRDDQNIQTSFKATATINGSVYDGTVTREGSKYLFAIKYPMQKHGTKIDVKITDGMGGSISKTYSMDYYIDYVIDVADKDIKQTQISGTTKSKYNYDPYGIIDEETVFTVAAKIGDKTYDGKVSGSNFTVTYPKQDFNTKVTLLVTDRCAGHTSKKTFSIDNHPPILHVDKIYYNSSYITGKTEPGLDIWVNAKSKNLSGKADSEGTFKIKIPAQKINSKITVVCTTKDEYFNSKDIAVIEPAGGLSLEDIVRSTSAITGFVEGGMKGDFISIKIGSRTYKKGLRAVKKQKFKVAINKPEVGQKVTVALYNKFKQKRFSFKTKVYLALKPAIGMTKKQVLQTAWGSADAEDKFSMGGTTYEQWGYDIDFKFVYLWFEKGILKSINSYSYRK